MSTPTTYAYLDTSPLVCRAQCDVTNPSPWNEKIARGIDGLLGDEAVTTAISEHTLLEYHNIVARDWRKSEAPEFDQEWAQRSLSSVMTLIAAGKVEMIPIPPKAAEHAMTLVTIATRDFNSAFRVWDALHLLTAAAWAQRVGSVVDLMTADTDFDRFISRFPPDFS